MKTVTRVQQRQLDSLGYPHVIACMSANDNVAEGCGEGAHSFVWKVAHETTGAVAVAKFWRSSFLQFKAAQERALRKAEEKFVSCTPRIIKSSAACTLMTWCPGITLSSFAQLVADHPHDFSIEGIERVLVSFVQALHELHAAGLYNDDMHDDNVLVDYGRFAVWIIDPYPTQKRNTDTGHRIVRILSRCISIVAAAQASEPAHPDTAMGYIQQQPHEYVKWSEVGDKLRLRHRTPATPPRTPNG